MKTLNIKAATAAEASAIYCAKRDDFAYRTGHGASKFPCGEWNGHHISYNGRVWEAGKTWPDAKAIYNPGDATPDIWADSTAEAAA